MAPAGCTPSATALAVVTQYTVESNTTVSAHAPAVVVELDVEEVGSAVGSVVDVADVDWIVEALEVVEVVDVVAAADVVEVDEVVAVVAVAVGCGLGFAAAAPDDADPTIRLTDSAATQAAVSHDVRLGTVRRVRVELVEGMGPVHGSPPAR